MCTFNGSPRNNFRSNSPASQNSDRGLQGHRSSVNVNSVNKRDTFYNAPRNSQPAGEMLNAEQQMRLPTISQMKGKQGTPHATLCGDQFKGATSPLPASNVQVFNATTPGGWNRPNQSQGMPHRNMRTQQRHYSNHQARRMTFQLQMQQSVARGKSFRLQEMPKVMKQQAVLFKSNQNGPNGLFAARISLRCADGDF